MLTTAAEDAAIQVLCRGQVVAEDGTVLCVMKDSEQRVSEWVDSLNSVIKPATSDTDGKRKTEGNGVRQTADSTTHPAGTSDGEDHVPRQLSEEPEVIKEGWLNILTDPAPGEDKLDNMQTKYCSLQRQGGRYRLEVYKGKYDMWRYDGNSDSYTYWTGTVATVCLDTARHAQLWSLCKVATMDGKVLCVMRETDDVMSRWVVSLNRAIMAARCQDTSQTATDSSDQADTKDRQGGVSPSEPQVEAVSHAEVSLFSTVSSNRLRTTGNLGCICLYVS
ncbi:uncharacterized protein [Littorina saxatilis]|uniref:uncharacterized protein n=1 Tax=Littorina saxatilis TaxID=31220 RepID=UPI0038B61FCA